MKIEAQRWCGQQSWELKGVLSASGTPTKVSITVGEGVCIILLRLPEQSITDQETSQKLTVSLSLPFRKI